MKTFEIPASYKSRIISRVKQLRRDTDPRKKDYSPSVIDFGPVQFLIARHFGFCYGVENAIEISYKAIEENPDKRIFLLSEMIHNQEVNNDLQKRGVKFLMETSGKQLIDWTELKKDDVVIVPAFGTTVEIQNTLKEKNLDTLEYDTTCPFVEKVWNRASVIGKDGFTVIVHGKHRHEETRATFSHSKENAPTVVVRDIKEAKKLGEVILGNISKKDFYKLFEGKYSESFDPEEHFEKIGVVNQTTMLAIETEAISEYFRKVMIQKYGKENPKKHFADTRDTLCYATHDNQRATLALLEENADLAIVIGGYNSSNTSHIVELCEEKLPTYFISSSEKIISEKTINHFDYHNQKELSTDNYLPEKKPLRIILTSGASCPDSIVDDVLLKILSYFGNTKAVEDVMKDFD